MQSAHHFNVQWLQRMTCRLDKVYTCVHSVVHDVHSVDLVLGIQVGIETLLNVLDNGSPRVIIVDKVTKPWGIDNGETETHTIFLDIGTY